jgi:hypothetical protein
MKAKELVLLVPKFIALVVLYFICFSVASALLLRPDLVPQPPADESGNAIVALFAVSLLNTLVLTWIILRSRWEGWRLILSIFLISYGVTTFMPQIETAVFVTRLPPGMLVRLFVVGAIVSGLFSPLAVIILGKLKSDASEYNADSRLSMPLMQWAWKLGFIAISYVIIYFTFGYFIAWKSPAVRAYYGGNDPGSFLAQIQSVFRDQPWLPPFQILRSMLWVGIALPVIKMMKGPWWEAGLAVALLFSVVMCSLLLLPNALMPAEVRMAHLVETASSNFLFGWLLVWTLTWNPRIPQSGYSKY